jgi:hypothetical protein
MMAGVVRRVPVNIITVSISWPAVIGFLHPLGSSYSFSLLVQVCFHLAPFITWSDKEIGDEGMEEQETGVLAAEEKRFN